MYTVIAQIIGIIAMILNCASYQFKKSWLILLIQLFGSVLFAVHFFMIKAYSGAILNIVGIVRAIIFIFKDKFHSDHIVWVFVFSVVYVLSYVFIFTVLGKEFYAKNAIVEFLPVVGMVITTVSFRFFESKIIRRFGLFNSPLWLTYNAFNFSIGGICSETFNLISIIVGIIRYDIKKEQKQTENKGNSEENESSEP